MAKYKKQISICSPRDIRCVTEEYLKKHLKKGIKINTNIVHLALFLILILLYSCSAKYNKKETSINCKKVLLERIEEFNKAFQEAEVEMLESMITQNYIHTNGTSQSIRKEAWLEYLKKRREDIDSGNLIVKTHKMQEIEVETYDDMAIVTAKIVSSIIQLGEYIETEHRITNVWVKEGEAWKRAGFHDGRIK